ncbi:class I SAM-dependent DNA methyltransferase [Lentzea flaviverrucosa]|uniref:class I SAM-dependent DNA methyltransferase n=1 Tax=Lentzea flaviverrucosa TaxID=200379 RepID=UPI0014775E4C|nr:class I SAM-dependent methyltransferase [Lentzea flaviverrucosa]
MKPQTRSDGDDRLEKLVDAVVVVSQDVLGVTDIRPDDLLLDLCDDTRQAVRIVALLRQWLAVDLTVLELLDEGTPRELAALLADRGASVENELPYAKEHGALPVGSWQRFWDTTYRYSRARDNNGLDTSGWFDNRTLEPLPAEQMEEWVGSSADRVRSLRPSTILDIGCGTGLMLFRLAPSCTRYVGVDFSAQAISDLRESVGKGSRLAHVELLHGAAIDAAEIVRGTFDVVLLNSVIQYFPDAAHLADVLSSLRSVVAPGGAIFVGDVRNADLREAFHTDLVTSRGPVSIGSKDLADEVAWLTSADTQLQVSPRELAAMADQLGASRFTALVRRGAHATEMNRFRFDAILEFGGDGQDTAGVELSWLPAMDLGAIERLVDGLGPGDTVVVRGLPDSRTHDAVRVWKTLNGEADGGEVASPLDPERLWALGARAGCGVAVGPGDEAGRVDVAFRRGRGDLAAARLLGAAVSRWPRA